MRPVKNRFKARNKVNKKSVFDVALCSIRTCEGNLGEPYIYHPIAVAKICAEEMDLDEKSGQFANFT